MAKEVRGGHINFPTVNGATRSNHKARVE